MFVASGTNMDKQAFSRAVVLARSNDARLTLIAVEKDIPHEYWQLSSAMPPDRVEKLNALMFDENREKLEQLVAEYCNDELDISIEVLAGTQSLKSFVT